MGSDLWLVVAAVQVNTVFVEGCFCAKLGPVLLEFLFELTLEWTDVVFDIVLPVVNHF